MALPIEAIALLCMSLLLAACAAAIFFLRPSDAKKDGATAEQTEQVLRSAFSPFLVLCFCFDSHCPLMPQVVLSSEVCNFILRILAAL